MLRGLEVCTKVAVNLPCQQDRPHCSCYFPKVSIRNSFVGTLLTRTKQGTSHPRGCKESPPFSSVAGDRRPLLFTMCISYLSTQTDYDGESSQQVSGFTSVPMYKFHRVDFAQPGHVLQVAAAVAYLKGVPLKQVVCGNPLS